MLSFWDMFWEIVKFILVDYCRVDGIFRCDLFGSDSISSANTEEQIQKSETAAEEE